MSKLVHGLDHQETTSSRSAQQFPPRISRPSHQHSISISVPQRIDPHANPHPVKHARPSFQIPPFHKLYLTTMTLTSHSVALHSLYTATPPYPPVETYPQGRILSEGCNGERNHVPCQVTSPEFRNGTRAWTWMWVCRCGTLGGAQPSSFCCCKLYLWWLDWT